MVNTVSYTNVFGEEISTATILSEMIANLQTRVQKGESSLTDVNIGSELRNIFEANTEGIYRLLRENDAIGRMQSTRLATGGYLDDKGYEVGLLRKGGTYASGSVIFSISTPLQLDYTIYAGTIILNSQNGLRYILENDVTIKAGSTWATGIVYSEGVGIEYNCPAHVLTAFDTEQYLRGDLEVDNDSAFENGYGTESDDDFRKRILNAKRGGNFGSWAYYKRICENIDGVHDVNFVKPEKLNAIQPNRHTIINSENETVQCNDCTAVCVINEEDGIENEADVLREVTELLTNQYNLVLGHEFHVQSSIKKKYFFSINYYAEEDNNVSEDEVVDCLKTLINGGSYVGKQTVVYDGFNVGDSISKEIIIDALENMVGIHHIESLKIMLWHSNISSIPKLTTWINSNKIYGATVSNPFVYSSVLDFPDEDDPQYKTYGGTTTVPAWKHIGANENGQEVYLLVADGYYFYKIKDNQINHDNNEGEYSLSGEEDYFGWGEAIFDEIVLEPDCVLRLGSLFDKQSDNTHKLRLHQLG